MLGIFREDPWPADMQVYPSEPEWLILKANGYVNSTNTRYDAGYDPPFTQKALSLDTRGPGPASIGGTYKYIQSDQERGYIHAANQHRLQTHDLGMGRKTIRGSHTAPQHPIKGCVRRSTIVPMPRTARGTTSHQRHRVHTCGLRLVRTCSLQVPMRNTHRAHITRVRICNPLLSYIYSTLQAHTTSLRRAHIYRIRPVHIFIRRPAHTSSRSSISLIGR
jgi:hypothetical protein